MPRMVGLEAIEKGQHVVCMRTDELAQQRLDARLVLVGELGLSRRDPKRRRATVIGSPHPSVRNGTVHVEVPPNAVLLHTLVRGREGPAPGGVVVEREREQLRDAIGLA
jgi:hypothetical protein